MGDFEEKNDVSNLCFKWITQAAKLRIDSRGQWQKQEQLEAFAIIQMRGDGGLDWGDSSKGGAKWSDSGSILKMEDLVIDVES